MMRAQLEQILAVRDIDDDQRRGFLFEQCVREILPWSYRPPLAYRHGSEQIDAFFEWNSWHFLVEAKASRRRLTAGSREWEDFELKVRKRGPICTGLFCCLGEVGKDVIKTAEAVNRESNGPKIIVLAGEVWEELYYENVDLSDVLRYLVWQARAIGTASPPHIRDIRKWVNDADLLKEKTWNIAKSASSTFLRRHTHHRHGEVYVSRRLDQEIREFASQLRPSALEIATKRHHTKKGDYTASRIRPPQICLIRDASGSGKTMTLVETALTNDPFIGVARAALESDIDQLDQLLEEFSANKGLTALRLLNQPLLYAIDSLDEAETALNKHQEVLSLVKLIDELDEYASGNGLIAYPVGLIFTVRYDYWQPWATIFEGQNVKTLHRRYSRFTLEEMPQAISKYSKSYGYSFQGQITPAAIDILSVPLNLHIFSEAHAFESDVRLDYVLDEDVLHGYFARKREDIRKRHIAGFTSDKFMRLLSVLATHVALSGENLLTIRDALRIFSEVLPSLSDSGDDILHAILSEQILNKDSESATDMRFRHSRFIEYLVAYNIILEAHRCKGPVRELESSLHSLLQCRVVSIFAINDLIRFICSKEFPELANTFVELFSTSSEYMTRNMRRLRYEIGHGFPSGADDLSLAKQAAESGDREAVWDAFFVLVAKPNGQDKNTIIQAFEIAWNANRAKPDRWKLIAKMGERRMLMAPKVFSSLLLSEDPKEWEVFLGWILEYYERNKFQERWRQEVGEKEADVFFADRDYSYWRWPIRLLQIALSDKKFIPGEAYK